MDDAALRDLFDRGYRYALSLTHDRARAEDLVQEAWLAILRRGAPRHAGYLFATIRNRFIDAQRRRQRRPEDADVVEALADHRPFLVVERLTLEAALAQLRPEERELLFLTAVEGYTVTEAATLIDRPRGTIASLLRRGKQKMLDWLSASEDQEAR